MRRLPRRSRTFSMAVLLALGLGVREPAARQSDSSTQPAGKEAGALLKVTGEVPRPLALSAEDFAKLPRRSIEAKGHNGVVSQYEGVSLIEVLAKAGVPTGSDLRGKEMTRYIVVEASDGYRALFSLAELDSAFTDRIILLADRRDGRRFSDRDGPLQVIVPGEKKHARWVRQVTGLVVGRA
jgi:DMSO/TMAO reductase YedYZ molybdopterin-dependent catalytic subunit